MAARRSWQRPWPLDWLSDGHVTKPGPLFRAPPETLHTARPEAAPRTPHPPAAFAPTRGPRRAPRHGAPSRSRTLLEPQPAVDPATLGGPSS